MICPNCGNDKSAIMADDGVEVLYSDVWPRDDGKPRRTVIYCRRCKKQDVILKDG